MKGTNTPEAENEREKKQLNMYKDEETTRAKETNVDLTMSVKMKITKYEENKSAERGNQH